MPVWSKYLLVLLVGVTPFFVKQWWFSLDCLVVAVVINLVVARIPVRTALSIGVPLWIANALILAYHCFFTMWQRGVIYVAGLLACLYIARLVTCTTDPGALMDAIVALARAPPPGGAAAPGQQFESQEEAEAWLSETWPELQDAGIDEVTLMEDDDVVYGPMELSEG